MTALWLPQVLTAAGFVVQGLLVWALWSLRRVFVRHEEFARQQVDNNREHHRLDQRLTGLEQRVAQLPDAEALAGLTAVMESVRGDIRAMEQRISGMDRLMSRLERVVERQEDFLRRQSA